MGITSESKKIVGPCGLYCGSCTMYRAYHDKDLSLLQEMPKNYLKQLELEEANLKDIACEGCRSSVLFKYGAECSLRKCASEKGVEWCYECEGFPCNKLKDWQSYWCTPLTENLREIQKLGLEKWLEQQKKKWVCDKCGTKLHLFSCGICPKCGESVPDPGTL